MKPGSLLRTTMRVGVTVAMICAVAGLLIIFWLRETLTPDDRYLQALISMVGGLAAGVLSAVAGLQVGLWWFRRQHRRSEAP